jgi:hypothetical protein
MPPIEVEFNLAIPRTKNPYLGKDGYPVDNSTVRFISLPWPEVPKPETVVTLSVNGSEDFTATVTRTDWNEELEIFTVSCKYAKRSISPEQCSALFNDPEWRVRPLL